MDIGHQFFAEQTVRISECVIYKLFLRLWCGVTLPVWILARDCHAQIEKCTSLMVKSLRFLMGRQEKRSRGAPPAPAVEYTAPAPAVISSPEPVVEYISPAPAVIRSVAPVLESIAPALAVISSPEPAVEYFATPASGDLFRQWWSIFHQRPLCSKLRRQWWSLLHPCQQLFLHQRLWWSMLKPCPQCFTRQCSLSLQMPRTCLRLRTCTSTHGSRCQCPSSLLHRSRVRSP